MSKSRANKHLWTNKMQFLALRDLIENRDFWHNTHSSFCGWTVREADLLHWSELDKLYMLSPEQASTIIFGNPDYVVYSRGLPILFHVTTSKDSDSEWVVTSTERAAPVWNHVSLVELLAPMLNNIAAEENMPWSD